MTEATKISSAQIFERFDDIRGVQGLEYKQAPLLVYKPNKGKGAAMKLECNLVPTFSEADENGRKWPRKPEGGVFLEIASEIPSDGDNAAFGWKETITSKLGSTDILAFLLAYSEVREFKRKIPEELRTLKKVEGKYQPDESGLVMGRIHKFDSETTIVEWSFEDKRSIVRIAKLSAKSQKSISLSRVEEVGLIHYLKNTLTAMQKVGYR